jgi:hypothetical protein
MLDLKPACMSLCLRDVHTKVSTILPTMVDHTLDPSLDSITDNNIIKMYNLLDLWVLEFKAVTLIVFGLDVIHCSPVHDTCVM